MEKVLVLGANGFIGTCLVNSLLEKCEVIGYDVAASAQFMDHARYKHVIGDYCSEMCFEQILKEHQISAVYHLICTTVPKDGTAHIETEIMQNVLPTIRLLDAMVKAGVKRIIFSSSGGTAYGEGDVNRPHEEVDRLLPICSYGIQKATIENYLFLYKHMYGLSPIIARIGNPYGPNFQKNRTQGIIPILIRKLMENEKIDLFGDTVRDYLYIDDVIRALVSMLEYQGKEMIFNVGSGDGVWLHTLIDEIETVVGKRFASISRQDLRLCDVHVNHLNIDKTHNELGWKPMVSLPEGIRKTYCAMNDNSEKTNRKE